MKNNRTLSKVLLFSILLFSFLRPQEIIDGIAAIVGDNVILKSELAEIVFRSALELQLDQTSDAEQLRKLQDQMLETLISQKIMLEIAEIETIEVQSREVDVAVEQYLNSLISQYGTEDRVEELAGKSMSEVRREFWPNMREQLITQRLQEQLLVDVTVTRNEVILFFEEYQDSLVAVPTLFNMSHILFNITPGKVSMDSAEELALSLRKRIMGGESFAELALQYSHDPGSSKLGGELGLVSRGTLVPEFEEVAFSLKPKEISGVVETEFGYHIIQYIDKLGEKINVRHILISPQVSDADEDSVYTLALSVHDSISSELDFSSFAIRYSDDKTSQDKGGALGWVNPLDLAFSEISELLPSFSKGEGSLPIRVNDGYHLVFIHDIKPGGVPNLSTHWSEIENLSLSRKKSEFFINWLEEMSSSIYIRNNISE